MGRTVASLNNADGLTAWGLLAVGTPGRSIEVSISRIEGFQSKVGGDTGLRGKFLFWVWLVLAASAPPKSPIWQGASKFRLRRRMLGRVHWREQSLHESLGQLQYSVLLA